MGNSKSSSSKSTGTSEGTAVNLAEEKKEISITERPTKEAGNRVTGGNIAAIDFGTTSVSLAFTTKGDDKVQTIAVENEDMSLRVVNVILLKKNEAELKVKGFGMNARKKFGAIPKDKYSEYIYFERIKMLMKREKAVTRETLVESFSGEKFYLVEVIAFILKYLKDQLIDHLSRTAKPLKTTDFDWVITVPAIWDARGKRMMREAAYLAGLLTETFGIINFTDVSSCSASALPLPKEVNPDKLSLALEPESAALYSQENVAEQIKSDPSAAAIISRPTEYMVIDIGGGTVDITAHVEVDGGIIVENIPTGNAWGGTQVNEAFSKMLQKLVEDPGYGKFLASGAFDKSQKMAVLNTIIYTQFEDQKVSVGKCLIDEAISIELPLVFYQFYSEILKASTNKISGVEYDGDRCSLDIDKEVVESQLFGPALDGIIKCTLEAIKENKYKVNTFYLVGGFGGCKYVHEKVSAAIKKAIHLRTCNVIVPKAPQLAVAIGAVIWRKNPEKFKARRSDATYGIVVAPVFDPDKHDEYYQFYHEEDKKYRCNNVFSVFLEKGELAKADETITTDLIPYSQGDTKMNITIYSTPNLGVQYIEDKKGESTVTKIGQLILDIPNPDNLPKRERKVDVTMDFSGTEIQAKAKYRPTGEEVKTVCDFLSAHKEHH